MTCNDYKNTCPICGYALNPPDDFPALGCQCRFSGSAHPDYSKRIRVVCDHLYLLSKEQIKHIIELQRWWQMSYGDEEMNDIVKELTESKYENKL